MLGAFNRVIRHQPIGQMHLFVAAKAIGRENMPRWCTLNGKGPPAMVPPHDILGLDVVQGADVGPGADHAEARSGTI